MYVHQISFAMTACLMDNIIVGPSKEAHVSLYPWSWLQQNSYDPPLNRRPPFEQKILWGSKIQQSPPTIAYEEVMAKDDSGLYKWLSNVVCKTFKASLRSISFFSNSKLSDSRSLLVSQSPRKQQRNLCRGLDSFGKLSVRVLKALNDLVSQDDRWQILGFHLGPRERRYSIYQFGSWGTHRQYLLCTSCLPAYERYGTTN